MCVYIYIYMYIYIYIYTGEENRLIIIRIDSLLLTLMAESPSASDFFPYHCPVLNNGGESRQEYHDNN